MPSRKLLMLKKLAKDRYVARLQILTLCQYHKVDDQIVVFEMESVELM